VTGASSGIGTAFAEWYADRGSEVVLVARDAAALSDVAENVRRRGGTAQVVRLCEAVVPDMVKRGSGDVIIVSSIAAFTPMRKAGAYAATKAHSTAYARSLSLEVRDKGVRVVAVCPGYVRTDLHRRAGLEHLTRKVPNWMWLSTADVVRATDRSLRRGRVVVVPGWVYRLTLPFLSSSLAQAVWRRLTRRT